MITRIDACLIRWVQAAYLWLYDRTGVYVGTVMAVSVIVHFAINRAVLPGDGWGFLAGDLLNTTILLTVCCGVWRDQDKLSIKSYNAKVMRLMDSPIRWLILPLLYGVSGGSILSAVLRMDAERALSAMSITLVCSMFYWHVVLIRERDPPQRFTQTAKQGI